MNTNLPLTPAKSTPRKAKPRLTQNYLKSILSYDPETGVFTWKERSDVPKESNSRFAGKEAGSKRKGGNTSYIYIMINFNLYLAHRLAWLYMTGEWPHEDTDHIDGNGLNNRFKNLRLATRGQNKANSRVRKDNKLGVKGVDRYGNKYRARIRINGRLTYLGYFNTAQEASAAYEKAARVYFGEFAKAN